MIARRYFDHAQPSERVDRRKPEPVTDRPSYSATWAWTVTVIVCLFVVPDNVRLRYERADLITQHAQEIARLQQRIAAVAPEPVKPVCREYIMEGKTVTHCTKPVVPR